MLHKLSKEERIFYSLNPFLVAEQCCEYIEQQKGLVMEGIYRINGSEKEVKQLLKCLVQKKPLPKNCDVFSVASLWKRHLQFCESPVIPHRLYYPILNKCDDIKHLKELFISEMPFEQFRTLRFILTHLNNVIKFSTNNKMNIKNVAIVFGATLLKSGAEENAIEYLQQVPKITKAFQTLLENYNLLFDIREEETKEPVDCRASTELERNSPVLKSLSPEWNQKRRGMTLNTIRDLFGPNGINQENL